MKKTTFILISLSIVILVPINAYSLTFVTVGNPGNPPDPSTGYGSVDYVYRISKYEITNTDYAAMLNDVAASEDPHNLYNIYMGYPKWGPLNNKHVQSGGIIRKGKKGNYSYYVISGYENKPVLFVSWRDAARFVNWLMTGNTESGTYDTSTFGGELEKRTDQDVHTQDAICWLPTNDEWYKAAYYDGNGSYWLYATQSNTPPVLERPPGNNNSANGGYINPYPYITDVGSYIDAVSYYGTHDQSGNIWEWFEGWEIKKGKYRGLRGGAYFDGATPRLELPLELPIEKMSSQWIYRHDPLYENSTLGFRIAATAISGNSTDIIVNRVQSIPTQIIKWGIFREIHRTARTWYKIIKMKWKNFRQEK